MRKVSALRPIAASLAAAMLLAPFSAEAGDRWHGGGGHHGGRGHGGYHGGWNGSGHHGGGHWRPHHRPHHFGYVSYYAPAPVYYVPPPRPVYYAPYPVAYYAPPPALSFSFGWR